MKKKVFYLLVLSVFIFFFSCQDEFCTEATTPSLIIEFYDYTETDSLKEIDLIVWEKSTLDTIFDSTVSATGTLELALDTQNESVTYYLSLQDTDDEEGNTEENDTELGSVEEIIINYTIDDVYVSKSCGFKSIFNNVVLTTTNNDWLLDSETTTESITNETEAHVKIYH